MTELRGLVVDYGGVLTNSTTEMFTEWAHANGVRWADFQDLLREWLVDGPVDSPVHALETGALAVADFEQELTARLRLAEGVTVPPSGLLGKMMRNFRYDEGMLAAVRTAHRRGIATALLSNSWGTDYPREGWGELFDAVVISGEVGLRKPDPRIYRLVADRIGLQPAQCVFVDDLRPNVRGAVAVGMVGLHHANARSTLDQLAALLGTDLRDTMAAAHEGEGR